MVCAALLCGCFLPVPAQAQGNQDSGIIGQVNGGLLLPGGIVGHPGIIVIPDHVRVYSDKGKLLTDVETEVMAKVYWHFEVLLKPGTYTVVAYSGTPPENGGTHYSPPVTVTVTKKQFTEVAIPLGPV